MSVLQSLWKRVTAFFSLLWTAASVLSTLLTLLTIAGLSSIVIGYFTNVNPLILGGIGAFIVAVLLFILLYSIVEARLRGIAPPDTSVYPEPLDSDADVELLLKEIVYQYFPDGQTMLQRKRFQIRALRSGVTLFTDRYKWTSSGKCEVRSIVPGYMVTNERREEFWNYYDIQFPHPLRAGSVADVTIEWNLFDEKKESVSFLSTMIDHETNHLSMRVVLPHNLAPKRAYCYEFRNYIDTLPISTEEAVWDPATQTIIYDVPNPKKYHKYIIRWYNE